MNQYDRANVLVRRIKDKESFDLKTSEYSVSSQNGENGIILEIISRVFTFEDRDISIGTFLEFGTGNGSETNLGFFSDWLKWSGTFIESDWELFKRLSIKYKYSSTVVCHHDFVTKNNINNYIVDNLDILSIDIDGDDYFIWEAVSSSPSIVSIEYNGSLPIGQKMSVKENTLWQPPYTTAFGASIEALIDLGMKKGYTLVHTDLAGVNAFFVLNKYADLFPESLNPTIHGPNYNLDSYSHQEETDMSKFITLEDK